MDYPTDDTALNRAYSVLNDPGSNERKKRHARATVAALDPEGFVDHDDDPIRSRGMYD